MTNALLVIVGALQVIVLGMQWRLIRRQDEYFTVSECAWILAELDWYPKGVHVVQQTSQQDGKYSSVNVKLICRNQGRSPAWTEEIRGYVEIIKSSTIRRIPKLDDLQTFGTIKPLGADTEQSRILQMKCDGHLKVNVRRALRICLAAFFI
jgi:hypothetical protein